MSSGGIHKRIDFMTQNQLGQVFAESVDVTRGGGGLQKIASASLHPEVTAYMRTLRPDPRYQYVLMTPMGAFEYWGMNANGDIFPELSLRHDRDRDDPIPVALALERRWLHPFHKSIPPGNHTNFGFKTFLEANRYRHHVNKDPTQSYGGIGLSVWNPVMHRVEVIVRHDREAARRVGAEDILADIDAGKPRQISMGCKVPFDACFPGNALIRTENGLRPISEIQAGDLVWTHLGRLRPVLQVYKREFDDAFVTLDFRGALPLEMTRNHPLFILPKEDVRACQGSTNGRARRHTYGGEATCSTCGKGELSIREVMAEDVRVGDYVTTPVRSFTGQPVLGIQKAYVLGVYAGDGSGIKQRTGRKKDGPHRLQGLSFACSDDDLQLERLCSALAEIASNKPKAYVEGGGKRGVSVRVYDQKLAQLITSACPGDSHTKRLVHDFGTREEGLAFLAGMIDSDGCYDDRGTARIVGTSERLLRDVWETAVRCKLHASIGSYVSTSGYGGNPCQVFQVSFPVSAVREIASYSAKLKATEAQSRSDSFFTEIDGRLFYCYAVTSVNTTDVVMDVHNLSVEEDESYLAGDVAVHNCTKCGHISVTPRDYCVHLKTAMGTVAEDGTVIGAVNFFPRFFDLSDVYVPAAKESGTLMKIASVRRGLEKRQSEEKRAEIGKTVLPNAGHRAVVQASQHEPNISAATLRGGGSFEELLSTLSGMGVVLKPHEFQYSLLSHGGMTQLADQLHHRNCVFSPESGSSSGRLSLSPDEFNPMLARLLSPLLGPRSGFYPYLPQRVLKIVVVRGEPVKSPEHVENEGTLKKVAHAYEAYRRALRDLPSFVDRTVDNHLGYYQDEFFGGLMSDSLAKVASSPFAMHLSDSLTTLYFYNAHRDSFSTPPASWHEGVATTSPARALLQPVL